MTDAFGAVTWWGFSPAIDLQDDDSITSLKNLTLDDSGSGPLNILLVGAGDLRHVLMTMAKSYKHGKRKIHFYILENNLELYARNMLFLSLILEPQTRMGLQEKTELFLELYGNILVRQQSEEYVEKMANQLIKMVTDSDYLSERIPFLDLSQLKYKERDFLEGIFKFWRNPEVSNVFEVSKYWDLRQRKYLGNRYDTRANVFDWDYQMRLAQRELLSGGASDFYREGLRQRKYLGNLYDTRANVFDWDYQMRLAQREADIIHLLEYKRWRETGIAFDLREADYDVPNKTLASGMVFTHDGEKHHRRGYWGDILASPYVPLGIQCEEKSFFKKSNKQYTKTACNVAEYNVLSMLHEVTYRSPYVLPEPKDEVKQEEKKGPTLTEITEEEEEEEEEKTESEKKQELIDGFDSEVKSHDTKSTENKQNKNEEPYEPLHIEDVAVTFLSIGTLLDLTKKKPLHIEDVAVTFLPIGTLLDLPKKSKYQKLFHLVYFSNSLVHLLKPEIQPMFADKACVIIESARYMLELNLDQVKLFVEKVEGMGRQVGCQTDKKIDPETANFIKMSFDRSKVKAS